MTTVTRVNTRPLAQQLRRALQLRRTRGFSRVLYASLRRACGLPLVRRCLGICATDAWRLPLHPPGPAPRPTSLFTIRLATPGDLPALVEYFGDAQRIDTRLARRDECVIAISQQKIGAAVWVSTGPNETAEDWEDMRCTFRYPMGVAWAYDGKGTKIGAWGSMMKQLPSLLRKWNIEEIATIIDCDNWQSFDAHKSLGYQVVGILLCLSIFNWSLHAYKPTNQGWRRLPPTIGQVEVV